MALHTLFPEEFTSLEKCGMKKSGKKNSWKNTPLPDHKPDILPPERQKNAASRGLNSGLGARNSLFLIHAVTQTAFMTWTNYLVCFSIFPFLPSFSNIISVFGLELPAAFRLGSRGCEETEWKTAPQFFSLPSSFNSFLALLISAAAEGCLSLWDGDQGLWLRQEWSRDTWYSLPAAKGISFNQPASSTTWRRKSSPPELFDGSLGANLGWDCLKQH